MPTLPTGLVQYLTGPYTLQYSDNQCKFICSGGTWTFSIQAGGPPWNGFSIYVRNNMGAVYGTDNLGPITLAPGSSLTIDGASSLPLCNGQDCTLVSDGNNWFTIGRRRYVMIGTIDPVNVTNQTILLPNGYRSFKIVGHNLRASAAGSVLEATVSTDGGNTFYTTANYTYGLLYTSSATAAAAQAGAPAYFIMSAPLTTGQLSSFEANIFPGDTTSNYPICNVSSGGYSSFENVYVLKQFLNALIGRVTALSLFVPSGTFLGNFEIYGSV